MKRPGVSTPSRDFSSQPERRKLVSLTASLQGRVRSSRLLLALTLGVSSITHCGPEKIDLRTSPKQDFFLDFDPNICGQSRPGLSLMDAAALSEERVLGKVRSILQKLPVHVTPRVEDVYTGEKATVIAYRFLYRNIPVCDLQVTLHVYAEELFVSGDPTIHPYAGKIYTDDPLTHWQDPWPTLGEAKAMISREFAVSPSQVELSGGERCVALDTTKIALVLNLETTLHNEPFSIALSKDKIRSVIPQSFHLTGPAKIYATNPKEGTLIDVPITVTGQGGKLESPRFKTVRTDGVPHVASPDGQYQYPPSTPEFEEVSLFANAERTAAWLNQKKHRYRFDCAPVILSLDTDVATSMGRSKENAKYIPPANNRSPTILVPSGGEKYKNLRTDWDVIAHEINHHVMTRTLAMPKKTEDELRVIHEGLADYLVYAMTGNTCLGESVVVGEHCLRSPQDHSILNIFSDPYIQASTLAGTLWNVRSVPSSAKVGAPPLGDTVDNLIFTTLRHVRQTSNYETFLKALLLADKELHDGRYACAILGVFEKAGYKDFLSNLDCKAYQSPAP